MLQMLLDSGIFYSPYSLFVGYCKEKTRLFCERAQPDRHLLDALVGREKRREAVLVAPGGLLS